MKTSLIRIYYVIFAYALISSACVGKQQTAGQVAIEDPIPGSCTIFSASFGDKVLYGNNEDYNNPKTYYSIVPRSEGNYGGVYFGFDDFFPQGGVNEKGLAYDANALPEAKLNEREELPVPPDEWAVTTMMKKASTVEEAIEIANCFQRSNWGIPMKYQVNLADATGDAVVISAGPDGELAFTRKKPGDGFLVSTNFNRANTKNAFSHPCRRYDKAYEMLEKIKNEDELTVDYFKSILDSTHAESGNINTLYSNVYDLRNGIIYLYHWHQFDEAVKLNVSELVGKGEYRSRIRDLFTWETVKKAEDEYQRYKGNKKPALKAAKESVKFKQPVIRYEPITGIGPEAGMLRRDPSDIIKVRGLYYVWYTKVLESSSGYPEGFNGTVWYATSRDGINWTEQGEALGRGAPDKFDAFGVFTPNILYAPTTKKYYLYYTGVRVENGERWDFKKFSGSIGVAVADAPDGGSQGWRRSNNGDPVINPRLNEKGVFDGWHTDDTVMFFREAKYWLYYKGHSLDNQLAGTDLLPGCTPMGVAVSERPDGDFKRMRFKVAQEFLVQPGHELLLWPYDKGILSLPTGHYRPKHPDDFCLHYSLDGMNFAAVSPETPTARQGQKSGLRAPGLYRPDLTKPGKSPKRPVWGLSMTGYGRNSGLQRFVLEFDEQNTGKGRNKLGNFFKRIFR